MAKCSSHYTKFKAVYFISTKDKALTTLVEFVQDFVMPPGLCLQHLLADGGSEFIADYYHDYCKTTVTMQQFSLLNTLECNSFSERDGGTITDVAQCMLNVAALPKSLWGKMAATVVFLLNHQPNKTIGSETSIYTVSSKHSDLFFLRTTGTRPHGGCQAHPALTSRQTRFPHHLQSKQ